MFDLPAYLARLGLGGQPDLRAIHRAHVSMIPFENLDPHRGVAVELDAETLQRKLVTDRRGGYCFEQNLLLGAALQAVGAQVEPMLARVRWGRPAGSVSARGHLLLRVTLDGAVWHADVGFGAGTLLEPIPFGPGGPYEQSGWRYRVIEEERLLVLQTEVRDGWADVYSFEPEPVPPVDIEESNWFTWTHPASPFVTGLIVSTQRADGTRVSLSDWNGLELVVRTPAGSEVTPVEREEIPRLLEERFALPGFTLDGSGRVSAPHRARANASAHPARRA